MTPGQDHRMDATEIAKLRAKLDGYEAMGLKVAHLRQLLDTDPEAFKATYMDDIKRQLAGGPATPQAQPGAGEEVEVKVGPLSEEERSEELELELEGAGPEESIRGEAPKAPAAAVIAAAEGPIVKVASKETQPPKIEPVRAPPVKAVETPPVVAQKPALTPVAPTPTGQAAPKPERPAARAEPPRAPAAAARDKASVESAVDYILLEAQKYERAQRLRDKKDLDEVLDDLDKGQGKPRAQRASPRTEELGPVEAEESELPSEEEEEAGESFPLEGPEEEGEEEIALEVTPTIVEPVQEGVAAEEEEAAAGAEQYQEGEEVAEVAEEPTPEEGPEAYAPAAAAAAAGPEVGAKLRPPRRQRRRVGKGVIAVVAVAILVIAALGAYFILQTNTPPTAAFTFSPDPAFAGQQVTFDASNSSDPDSDGIRGYDWDFGDSTTGDGRIAVHEYGRSGNYTVKLTVTDNKNARSVAIQSIQLAAMTVTMAPPHIGDTFHYNVDGHTSISNPDGFYSYTVKIATQITPITIIVKEVRLHFAGEKTATVDNSGQAEDGFMRTHDVRIERTVYNLPTVDGLVLTNQIGDAPLSGTITGTVIDYICDQWDRPVKATVDMSGRFTVDPDFVFTESDKGTFYNGLDNIATSFSLQEFLRSNNFSTEDSADHQLQVGSGTYIWRSRGMERVEGRTAFSLHINVTMDPATKKAAGLDGFFTDVWLEPGLSQPAKTHAYTKAYSSGNTVIMDVTERLTSGSNGPTDVGKTCIPETHAYTAKGEFAADFAALGLVPDMGGTSGGFAISPTQAVDTARASLPDFDAWLSDRPEAFCHNGNYSVVNGHGGWQLAFGTKGSSDHYRITVRDGESAQGQSYVDSKTPKGTREDKGAVVTLSRGLKQLRNQTDVRNTAFSGNAPDWNRFNLSIGEGGVSLPASVTGFSSSTGGVYVYMLESRNDALSPTGKYRAALDATNGQVLFSWTQTETREGRIGGVG